MPHAIVIAIFTLLLMIVSPLQAQTAEQSNTETITIEQLQSQLDEIPEHTQDQAELQQYSAQLTKIQQQAKTLVEEVNRKIGDIDQKLNSISTSTTSEDGSEDASPAQAPEATAAPSTETTPEAAFVAEQRSALQQERERLDAQRQHLNLIISSADEKAKTLVAERRQRFKEELMLKVPSVFSSNFWTNWQIASERDVIQLNQFKANTLDTLGRTFSEGQRFTSIGGILLAALIVLSGLYFTRTQLNAVLVRLIPTGRARRSLFALAKTVLPLIVLSFAYLSLYHGINWNNHLGDEFRKLSFEAFTILLLATFIYSLGNAVLLRGYPTWRLFQFNNVEVNRLHHYPLAISLLALLYLGGAMLIERLGLSFTTEVNAKSLITILLCVLALRFFNLLSQGRVHLEPDTEEAAKNAKVDNKHKKQRLQIQQRAHPVWLTLLISLAMLIAGAALIATLFGYVGLGSFVINQLIWLVIVSCAFYICWKLAADIYYALGGNQSRFGKYLINAYDVSEKQINQVLVLLSALSRIAVLYFFFKILILPFGSNINQFDQLSQLLNNFFELNSLALSTSNLMSAIFVLIVGFWLIRLFKHWLEEQYFPTTTIERGVQSSISTMSGYIGGVIVIALTLGSLGLSFDKITWVASALSVGIGFGLQSIVQNFISGLMLLTERPVKVGDWVVVGDNDGDIKRINIRATEIQLQDRSTLIVPNSEFITKSIRNMTLNRNEGRIQFNLALNSEKNPRKVSELVLAAFEEHEQVLDSLKPYISLDSKEDGTLVLTATCYVASPRLIEQVRTELLFDILERIHGEDASLLD